MKINKIETGNFKLDGGAMFGVVPKSLWSKVYPADENNMCNLAMRCLLIEDEKKIILVDTGMGDKQDEKFFRFYYPNGKNSLLESVQQHGFQPEDITDVVLTHLHFDHCGGAISKDQKGNLQLTFSNANYWISKQQWYWARKPYKREKPSFLTENIDPIESSGKLRFIDSTTHFSKNVQLRLFNGHTAGLILPFVKIGNRTLVYVTDLIPTASHIPASWVCGFDSRPLISIEERERFMREALENNYVLFFEHDLDNECCTIFNTEKGIRLKESFTLEEFHRKE